MAKVQAIEITDGEHTILMLFLAIMQAAYDLHVTGTIYLINLLKVHILPVSVIVRNEVQLSGAIAHFQQAGLFPGKGAALQLP